MQARQKWMVFGALLLTSTTGATTPPPTGDPRKEKLAKCIKEKIEGLQNANRIHGSSPVSGLYVACPSPQGVVACDSLYDGWLKYRIPQAGGAYALNKSSLAWHEDENDGGQFQGMRTSDGDRSIEVHLFCEQTTCFGAGLSIGGHVTYDLDYSVSIDEKRRIAGKCLGE